MMANAELVIRNHQNMLLNCSMSTDDLLKKCVLSCGIEIPTCHDLKVRLLKRYVRARVHFHLTMINNDTKHKKKESGCMGSKSVAMRYLADLKK
jgi:hypothetical protein